MNTLTIARLENWQLHFGSHGVRLTGEVYDHPDYSDGSQISTIVERDQINPHSRTFASRNAIYRLGKPEMNGRRS